MRGGKPHLIGGLSEFWEYCYDYYGLETFLSHNELQKLNNDFQQVIMCTLIFIIILINIYIEYK